MAYDDSRFRGEPGFREEPDFRSGGVPEDAPTLGGVQTGSVYTPGAYPVNDYGGNSGETTSGRRVRTPSAAQLDDVFDDPDHGEPGRDRMAVHAMWELVLFFAVLALAFLLNDAEQAALRGAGFNELLVFAAALGLIAVGMGLSLRAAVPNLALGPMAYGAALWFADNSERGLAVTAGVTAVIAAAVGVVLAILVVGFHVPGWAASLGVAFGVMVLIQRQDDVIRVVNGAYNPTEHAEIWFGGFAAIAVLGGLFGLAKPIRRGVGRFRPIGDPAQRRGGAAGTVAVFALIGSSVLAAVAGVLLALEARELEPTENGLAMTGLALGAVLLGGTSAFGRRGGIFGTVLATALMVLLMRYAEAERWQLSSLAVAGAAIFAGLIVTRLVETFGRPRTAEEEDDEEESDWTPSSTFGLGGAGSADNGWSSRTGGWTSQLPARATDDGWGSPEQRWDAR
jgi:ribose/xylose/arabinose/galactoside ABC-type transport system permease subunit